MQRVLIAGCGYVGCRLAERLVEEDVDVWGLRRDVSRLPAGVRGMAADVGEPETLAGLPWDLDAVVYAVSPAGRSREAYRQAYVTGLRNVLRAVGGGGTFQGRVVLVSSTGVYGQADGRRVDEDTPPEPASATGEVLLEGETVARGQPAGLVLRLGGIYGPGRTRTIRRVLDGEAGCPPPDRYGNRIHREDAAGALRHLLFLDSPADLYLGVDRDPAPLREVHRWIAGRAGAPDPCRDDGDPGWEPTGRRRSNKRCSSDRLVESGYEFRYPTFREGYGALLDSLDRSVDA